MCRNLKPLFNFEPPATEDEIHIASLQFVRKISGFSKPSKANEVIFNEIVGNISLTVVKLLANLVTKAKPKNRDTETEKAKIRFEKRLESLNS
ncbi:MAG: DUF2277 domain-containing protein [Candidatus Heimdallarchaeota archaeon]|nr:DUF2277 domain-containing protein [Candidatus Heimdallarchaeota archaeon]